MKKHFILFLTALLPFTGRAQNNYRIKDNVVDLFRPVDIRDVKVRGEIGRRIDITIHNNIERVDTENDFILPFVKKNSTGNFVGIGMYIDAVTKFAAHAGNPEIIKYKDHLIDRVIAAQEKDGYTGMIAKENRMWNYLWDIHEMAHIIIGLTTNYLYFDDQKSLTAAVKNADYIISRWHTMPDNWEDENKVAMHVALTGIDKAIFALYRITGQEKYLDFSRNIKPIQDWDVDIVMGRRDKIYGHIYAYLSMCMAQLDMYRVFPDEQLLSKSGKVMDFLSAQNGMLISGEAGQWEIWTNNQDGESALGETCATAHQIYFYDNLFCMNGGAYYGDVIERTIHNGLFAAQSPEGRKIRYYTPLCGQRHYHENDTYCCPNNYRRIISDLPGMIYYHTRDGGICINQYTSSSLDTALPDRTSVRIEQSTDYPNSGKIEINISVSQAKSFPVMLRIPAWAKNATVSINNTETIEAVPGNFLSVSRTWNKGDRIILDIPMESRWVKGREQQAGRVALMRGPVLFCLNPAKDNDSKLSQLTPAELERILIDPSSLQGPFADESVRPRGMAYKIGAWFEGHGMSSGKHDLELFLTEFPNPDGKSTYFNLADQKNTVDDELIKVK